MKPEELDELDRMHKTTNAYDEPFDGKELGRCWYEINRTFPALLALARDGVRYRELFSESETGGLMVQESAMKERT